MLQSSPLSDLISIDHFVRGLYVAVKGELSLTQTPGQARARAARTHKNTQQKPYSDPGKALVCAFVCYKTKRWTLSCLKALLGVSGALSHVMLLVALSQQHTIVHTHARTCIPTVTPHTTQA